MKAGFIQAMEAFQDIQYGDQQLEAKVQHNKAECEQQLGDVVQMVLALKVRTLFLTKGHIFTILNLLQDSSSVTDVAVGQINGE